MTTSFTVKNLRFTFILANNAVFAGTNSNTLKVSGLKASVSIKGSGLPAFPEASITVYGMLLSDMIALNALAFQPLAMQRNTVIVEADSGQGFTTVFSGQIITGGPNFQDIPATKLTISARILGFESLNPATPTSYTGTVAVSEIVASIASKIGYVLEDNGVTAQLSNSYFAGTLVDQLRAVAKHAGIDVYTENNVIAICPKGVPRNQPTWVLSPTSGLAGYPVLDYNRGYVNVKALFNPAFRFGGPITVQGSIVPTANGSWVIGAITHTLETITNNGQWFSQMLLYPPGTLPPVS